MNNPNAVAALMATLAFAIVAVLSNWGLQKFCKWYKGCAIGYMWNDEGNTGVLGSHKWMIGWCIAMIIVLFYITYMTNKRACGI